MLDQAAELRKLVLRSVRQQVTAAGPAPRLVVVAAGKVGVGATTTAVTLAIALAEHGSRVVIVDADAGRSGVASLCGLEETPGTADVVSARRDIHEVLLRGPAGIQVAPGLFAGGRQVDWSQPAQQRLLRQLNTLGRHADVVVLDTGAGGGGFLRRCCATADDILIVTTVDDAAVMETYACIKSGLGAGTTQGLDLVVNQCNEQSRSRDVHARIDQSCQRFLGHRVRLLAAIPRDPQVPLAAAAAPPLIHGPPAIMELFTEMASELTVRPSRRQGGIRDAA